MAVLLVLPLKTDEETVALRTWRQSDCARQAKNLRVVFQPNSGLLKQMILNHPKHIIVVCKTLMFESITVNINTNDVNQYSAPADVMYIMENHPILRVNGPSKIESEYLI